MPFKKEILPIEPLIRTNKLSRKFLLNNAADPAIKIDGDVWIKTGDVRGRVGADIGEYTFVADP